MSLAKETHAPFSFHVDLVGANATKFKEPLRLEEGTLSGYAELHGRFGGKLYPDRLYLQDANAQFDVTLRDGTIGNLPTTLLLARLPSLAGVRGLFGQDLPYSTMTASCTIDRGILRTPDFALAGPELSAIAAGQIDVLSDEMHTDMVVALRFFRSVDWLIERVPVVGNWVLGDDESLLAVYVHVKGPWKDPGGTLLAPHTLENVAGWPGKIIGTGARRLFKLLPMGRSDRNEDDRNGESTGS